MRPFSSSAVAYRAPSIRDVTASSAEEFSRRQKEFRENLEEARKRKEQQESQSVNASLNSPAREFAPTAPHVSNASIYDRVRPPFDAAEALDNKALGSLAMRRYIGEDQQQDPSKRGPLSSLIYGTKEGQHFDKDIERSFSQVLARGKYVHSIVFHDVKPDKVDEYVDLVGEWYPRMAGTEENRVNLVGSWRTQVGDNETFGNIPISPERFHGSADMWHVLLKQSTFGSTSAMRVTTPPCTTSRNTPNSPSSIAS